MSATNDLWLEDFVSESRRYAACFALSPDGSRLACALLHEDKLLLHVRTVASGETEIFDISEYPKDPTAAPSPDVSRSPYWATYVEWATNERIVYRLSNAELYGINPDGSNRIPLLTYNLIRGARESTRQRVMRKAVVSLLPEQPDVILAHAYIYESATSGQAYATGTIRNHFGVNIHTGEAFQVAKVDETSVYHLVDQFGFVRGSLRPASSFAPADLRLHDFKRSEIVSCAEIFPVEVLDAYGLRYRYDGGEFDRAVVFGFAYNPDLLFFASDYGRDTFALFAADARNRSVVGPVFAPERFDVVNSFSEIGSDLLVFVPEKRTVGGFRYEDLVERTVWRLEEFSRAQAAADQKFDGAINRLFDWDQSLNRFLVYSYTSTNPGSIWLLDVAPERFEHVAEIKPGFDPSLLGETIPVWVPCRDGREMVAYLTLPPGHATDDPLPVVVWLQSSPATRPGLLPSAEVHQLASEGFLVMRLWHRGGSGFGREHREAGRGRYVEAVMEDIEDAVTWATSQNLIDPEKVTLWGHKWGAYVALNALAEHPGRFAGAIADSPVVDAVNNKSVAANWISSSVEQSRGARLRRNEDYLKRTSPLRRASVIVDPVLLRVDEGDASSNERNQARRLHQALRHNASAEYVLVAKMGTDESTAENTRRLFEPAAVFLRKHVAGAPAAAE